MAPMGAGVGGQTTRDGGARGFTPPRFALRFATCEPILPLQGRMGTSHGVFIPVPLR
jgi:hypothetical protein